MDLLLDSAIRITGILLTAFTAMYLSRAKSASLRHWILTAALLCVMVTPLLIWISLRFVNHGIEIPDPISVSIQQEWTRKPLNAIYDSLSDSRQRNSAVPVTLQAAKNRTDPPRSASVSDETTLPIPSMPMEIPASAPHPGAGRLPWIPMRSIPIMIWIGGLLAGILSLIAGSFQIRRIARDSHRVTEPRWVRLSEEISAAYGLRHRVEILECGDAVVLATWGVIHPRLLLPTGAADWSGERIRMVLHHELAHVRRRDWPIQILSQVLRAIYWFNPLCWMACNRLVQESEQACDDVVLSSGISESDYAAQLLAFACPDADRIGPAAVSMARRSTLERRFAAILNPQAPRGRVRTFQTVATLLAFIAITLFLGSLRVSAESTVARLSAAELQSPVHARIMNALAEIALPFAAVPQGVPNSIQGVVVKWGTSDPISDVDVELTRVEGTALLPLGPLVFPPGNYSPGFAARATYPNPADIWHVRTATDGKFSFSNLKAGKYRLQAARAGGAYYAAEYGQHNPRGRGFNFQFTEGQVILDLKLPMAENGTISGRVLDADGTPAAHVRMLAMEASYQSGHRILGLTEVAESDDRGEYRLYYLPPGQYFIGARPEDPRRRFVTVLTPLSASMGPGEEVFNEAPIAYRALDNGDIVEETFATIFYGGDADAAKARAINLLPGARVSGINLSLVSSRVRAVHVRGLAIDGNTGAPAAGISVRAFPQVWSPSVVAPNATTDPNGAFDIPGLAQGAYILRANTGANGNTTSVIQAIDVAEKNIDNVRLVLTPGASVHGRIVFEGPSGGVRDTGALLRAGLTLDPPSFRGDSLLPGRNAAIRDNEFTIGGIQPGTYRFGIDPILAVRIAPQSSSITIAEPLQNLYVKSVQMGSQDVLRDGVRIGGEDPGLFEVVIGTNGGTIEGVVKDSHQQAVPNAVAVLVPASTTLRGRTDLYKSANSDESGAFKLRGIAPGEYRLFSFDYAQDGVWFDPEFIQPGDGRGKSVLVLEGSNSRIDLSVIEGQQ